MKSEILLTIAISLLAWTLLAQNSNVGIGTNTPAEKLDVNGNVRLSGELMPNAVAGTEGQVLQSNGSGSMQWAEAAVLQGSVGFGSWGCDMSNITEYQPVADPEGENNDIFGYGVAISGERAVVSAYGDDGVSGSALVFTHDPGTGQWVQDGPRLVNYNSQTGDFFGRSVSIFGDRLAIGATHDDTNGVDAGSVSVYERNSSGNWELMGNKVIDPDYGHDDRFGYSVCLYGDYLAVGAIDDDISYTDQGSVSFFEWNPSSQQWEMKGSKITGANPNDNDNFGYDVDISGEYAIIGEPHDDLFGLTNNGSVTIYKRNPSTGVWEIQGSQIYNTNTSTYDFFGQGVALSGDYAMASAPGEFVGGIEQGTVTVFKRNSSTGDWEPFGPKLTLNTTESETNFGYDISMSGNYAMIGSLHLNGPGAAYLYVNVGATWMLLEEITDRWGDEDDDFGSSCAITDSTHRFVIGALSASGAKGKVVFGKY